MREEKTEAPAGSALAHALKAAGLNPRELMRAVNQRLMAAGYPRVAENAAYRWVQDGGLPREGHVPPVVASVLSSATGRCYVPADLWPTKTTDATVCISADDGLGSPWQVRSTLERLNALCTSPGPRRRTVAPISGLGLITATQAALLHRPDPLPPHPRGARIPMPLVETLEQHVRDARRLDDLVGGGPAAQRYVTGQLSITLDLLQHGRRERTITTRLLKAAADLAQIAGWMHFDARAHGTAQRYLLLSLRLARAFDDKAAQANVIGMLAYQAAHTNARHTAVELAEAAVTEAGRQHATVRARALGRLATAYAAIGEPDAFERAADKALDLLERSPITQAGALYYLTPRQLQAETGQGLVTLAATCPGRRGLLERATEKLTPLTQMSEADPFQRSALLHGTYLAEARLRAGDGKAAAAALTTALDRLASVGSARCRHRLAALRAPLVRRRDPDAEGVLARLDQTLASA